MRKFLAVLAAATMLAACDSIPADKPVESTEHHEGDGHDHSHDHDHDHAHDHDHDHGEHHELGTAAAAGVSFEALQLGHPANGEVAVEVVLAEGSPAPKAIRAWVGNQAAEGSMKTRAEGAGPAYDMHLELPDPLPADAQIWLEIEAADGTREAKSFELIPGSE